MEGSSSDGNDALSGALRRAIALHQAGRLPSALRLYQEVLDNAPDHVVALNLAGVAIAQSGDPDEGLRLIRKSLALHPDYAEAHNNLGTLLQKQGCLEDAATSYLRATQLQPGFAEAWCHLGNTRMAQGRAEDASEAYRRALDAKPDLAAAEAGLALALQNTGDLRSAEAVYRRAIEANPNSAVTHNNFGSLLQRLGRLEEAFASYHRALEIQPNYAKAKANLGAALQAAGQPQQAAEAYRLAAALDPQDGEIQSGLGLMLEALGDLNSARDAFAKALHINPSDATARHMLAALSGRTTKAAPKDHVRRRFDSFSTSFEARVVGSLGYHAPAAMRDAVLAIDRGTHPTFRTGLDIGCGTGLVAKAFDGLIEKFDGVDLAPRMIERAEATGLYQRAYVAEIVEFLADQSLGNPSYDLVTAADVFIYIGDLDALFHAVACRLSDAGLFVFTIEDTQSGDFVLRTSGRYAQSEAYIRRLADDCGLRVLSVTSIDLRREKDEMITGLIFVLEKPSTEIAGKDSDCSPGAGQ